jgi:hypothetical protein
MAAAALTPRVRMMAICDGVRESKFEAGVFHLKGVRQRIAADPFPFVPARLWLFLLFSNPRAGEFPCHVRVVHDRTERIVFYMHLEPRPTFGVDGGLFAWYGAIRCRFPEEGQTTVQVWFFQEQSIDVLKAEMPFYLATERS